MRRNGKVLRGGQLNSTRKIVKPIKIIPMKAAVNRTVRNNKLNVGRTAIPFKSLYSIRNLPSERPQIAYTYNMGNNRYRKINNTKKVLRQFQGSRNLFQSMESKKNFKKILKGIYGNRSENVYRFWQTYKNNLKENLRNREAKSRGSFSSNNSAETNTMINNKENPELYKELMNIYGRDYAEFQDYKARAKKQGMYIPFNFNTTRKVRSP